MRYVPKQNQEDHKERELREERLKQEAERSAKRKMSIMAIVIVLLLVIGGWITYASLSPGRYDNFAKCLTEKGAVMYGEDWCQYTNAQKGMFGKSFKYINYEQKQDLKVRPTWVINDKTYETVQSFERLSKLTGCKF